MPSAIILAGGQGRRLGRDKASTVVAGKTLLDHVLDRISPLANEVIVVKRPGQELPPRAVGAYTAHLRPGVVEDLYPGKGPLGGLYTGLSVATSFPAIAVACDMPLLQPALLEELLHLLAGYDAVVPVREGLPQPLCAAYAQSCLESLRARLELDQLRLIDWLDDIRVRWMLAAEWQRFDPEGLSFFNLNTPEDLAKAEALLGGDNT